MICRNAKNCVRMTGLVAGYHIRCCADRSRQLRRVPGRCKRRARKRQEHRGQAFVRKESVIFLVRAGASPGGGPQACPAGSAPKILANPAFGRHWLRSGKQLQNPAFGWVPVWPGNFFEPLLDPRIYAHPALDRSIPRVTAGILVVRSAESSGLILRRAPGAAGRCC